LAAQISMTIRSSLEDVRKFGHLLGILLVELIAKETNRIPKGAECSKTERDKKEPGQDQT
jgi:hypothetical protein